MTTDQINLKPTRLNLSIKGLTLLKKVQNQLIHHPQAFLMGDFFEPSNKSTALKFKDFQLQNGCKSDILGHLLIECRDQQIPVWDDYIISSCPKQPDWQDTLFAPVFEQLYAKDYPLVSEFIVNDLAAWPKSFVQLYFSEETVGCTVFPKGHVAAAIIQLWIESDCPIQPFLDGWNIQPRRDFAAASTSVSLATQTQALTYISNVLQTQS